MLRIFFLQPEQFPLPVVSNSGCIGKQQLKRRMQKRHFQLGRSLGQLVAGQSALQTPAQKTAEFTVLGMHKIIFIAGMNMEGNKFSPLDKQALFDGQQQRINRAVQKIAGAFLPLH